MKPGAEKTAGTADQVVCGLFSKKEAAGLISEGKRHVHSAALGARDACARLTIEAAGARQVAVYPWELTSDSQSLILVSSASRYTSIKEIIANAGLASRRTLREKTEGVLEELLTNAIYHAYRHQDGSEKYRRKSSIDLPDAERVKVRFQANPSGIFLRVSDRGGRLSFNDIGRSFSRCYGPGEQIEVKEAGAGLGMYMAFETTTHLKIVVRSHASTEISCWLSDKSTFDPDTFSFNFFEGETPKETDND